MRKFLPRAASGVAVAAVATMALAGTASAAPVPMPLRAHTTLSIVEWRTAIRAGQKDVISGTFRADRVRVAKQVVLLERVVGRHLVPVSVELTNRAGTVAFTVRPKVTARYELVFRGTRRLAPTHSGVVTVKVIP